MLKLPERYTLIEKKKTHSTNTDAKNYAENGAPDFTLIWAHHQTAGRGRGHRHWISQPGNLFWSVILREGQIRRSPETIVFVAAMAIVDAITHTLPDSNTISIKWPNDVLINGAKISGTLTETNSNKTWLIVGIGINLMHSPAAHETFYPTTCLAAAGSSIQSVAELCERLSKAFAVNYDIWSQYGLNNTFRQRYHEKMWKLGESIDVSLNLNGDQIIKGLNKGIDAKGQLQLEDDEGQCRTVNAGDILFRQS